jgi:hypothetical protein
MPGFVEPCDPTLRDDAPRGPEWVHEVKIDGYRAQLHIRDGQVKVYSRKGYDWTEQFGQIARAAAALAAHDLIIDGEATVLGTTGLPDFQALRRELAKEGADRLTYLAFDLLYLDGYDLRRVPLIERKRALKDVLAKAPAEPERLASLVREAIEAADENRRATLRPFSRPWVTFAGRLDIARLINRLVRSATNNPIKTRSAFRSFGPPLHRALPPVPNRLLGEPAVQPQLNKTPRLDGPLAHRRGAPQCRNVSCRCQ